MKIAIEVEVELTNASGPIPPTSLFTSVIGRRLAEAVRHDVSGFDVPTDDGFVEYEVLAVRRVAS